MTIHEPEVKVTCDGTIPEGHQCSEKVYLSVGWGVGGCDLSDEHGVKLLWSDHDWLTVEGKHYCCDCKPCFTI